MIPERERAALSRTFGREDAAEVEAAIEAGHAFVAFDKDGSARIVFRSGDTIEPAEELEEERE